MRVKSYTERERGQRSGPPKLARDPWETVKFESHGGAQSAPSLRTLQGSGGEQVEACEKTATI